MHGCHVCTTVNAATGRGRGARVAPLDEIGVRGSAAFQLFSPGMAALSPRSSIDVGGVALPALW
jgi:hypothetical protein